MSALCVISRVQSATRTKADLKQASARPHEVGKNEGALDAHLTDKRDGSEGEGRALFNRAMTQDEVDSDAKFLEFRYVAQGRRCRPDRNCC